jgi:hypothetical protein
MHFETCRRIDRDDLLIFSGVKRAREPAARAAKAKKPAAAKSRRNPVARMRLLPASAMG